AIKYSGDEKLIKISSLEFNGQVQVCVKDKGIGINAGDKSKLFDRYYRVKRTETKLVSGFGLGLYLSSEIIKRHGGTVWVESKINLGSSFFFSLPSLLLQ